MDFRHVVKKEKSSSPLPITWSEHGYLVVLPALFPLIKEDFDGYLILGLLISIVFSIYGWGSLLAGVIADHWSRRKAIILSMVLCSIASLFIALSYRLLFIIISLIILGTGTALYHPVGFSYIAFFTDKTRGRWIGIHGLAGNIGMAMGFITPATIGYFAGWRNTFVVWAGIGAMIAIMGGISPLFAGFLADTYSMNWIFYFFSLISARAFVFCFQLRIQTIKSTEFRQ